MTYRKLTSYVAQIWYWYQDNKDFFTTFSNDLQNRVIVNQSNVQTILSSPLDSTKEYFIDGVVNLDGLNVNIEIPSTGINITGYDFDISKIICSEDNFDLFISPVSGSGNIFIENLTVEVTGVNSNVYNIKSASGFEAIEVNRVNFDNCSSLGVINNYRQILETNTGRFGGTPELELIGVMNGCRISTSIVRGISNISSLFKEGTGLSFSGRFITDINCDLPAIGALVDFQDSNFNNEESLILKGAFVTRQGVIDTSDATIYPNIDETSIKSLWTDNTGVPNTTKYLKSSVTSEVNTVISVIDTYYVLEGIWTTSNLSHFDMPSNGEYRLLSGNGTYQISGDLSIEGTSNDVIDVRVTKSTDGGVTYPIEVNHIRRQINSLVGSRDIAFFPINFITSIKKNERLRFEVENKTSTDNLTVELDSFIIITST